MKWIRIHDSLIDFEKVNVCYIEKSKTDDDYIMTINYVDKCITTMFSFETKETASEALDALNKMLEG